MKVMFRNILVLVFLFAFVLIVAACGSKTTSEEEITTTQAPTTTTAPNASTTDETTTTSQQETGDYPDLGGATIVILHGNPLEVDPKHKDYSGKFQSEKVALQNLVEERYHVKIEYKLYEDGAGWGADRINKIIEGVSGKKPMGHIYAISSNWISQLADAEAIAPIKRAIRDYANENYDDTMKDFGSYKDEIYAMESGFVLNDAAGIYYNLDLLEDLGLENPATKWLDGEWNWETFEAFVDSAQAKLTSMGEGYYAMGGKHGVWAQHMIPANGGYLINPGTKKVAFDQNPSLQTLNFLNKLYNKGVWEPAPEFDAGSANWKTSKVLLHPGELWFLNADNRWKLLDFDFGFVPYPVGNNKTNDDYITGKDSMSMYAVSGGYNDPNGINAEVLFRIWNDLQYWQPYDTVVENFEMTLIERYDDADSVDAHLSVLTSIYQEYLFSLGYSGHHTEYGWYIVGGKAVTEGDASSKMTSIKSVYQTELDKIFQ